MSIRSSLLDKTTSYTIKNNGIIVLSTTNKTDGLAGTVDVHQNLFDRTEKFIAWGIGIKEHSTL